MKRPWGEYKILFKDSGYQVKRILIKPGCRFSLQKHLKRLEKWIILAGTGQALVASKNIRLKPGVVLEVPKGVIHRMHNTGKKPLIFIEAQFGSYLGEDDIIRFQDDFGRK